MKYLEYKLPNIDRFELRVLKHGPLLVPRLGRCWQWDGDFNGYAYPRLWLKEQRGVSAAKWYYEYLHGPIAKGFEPDHLCRNRGCVRPTHLEPVPKRVNTLRGMGPPAKNARKTKCPLGHELSGPNLMTLKDGRRSCRICHRASHARWQKKNKGDRR